MSFEDRYFAKTEESRIIFRNLRFTLVRLGIWTDDKQIMRKDTHNYCLKWAIKNEK